MVNGNIKGKAGEREFASVLRGFGFEARRGQQYSGIGGEDVVSSVEGVHFEVKRVERLNVMEAYAQATRDAGDKWPVVAHRRNRGDWMVTLSATHFLQLVAANGIDSISE